MPYNTYILGYRRETTFGTSLITDASSTAYLLGMTSDKIKLPDPSVKLVTLPPSLTKPEIQGAIKPVFNIGSTFALAPQDGIPAWFVLGKSVTTGGSPPYTHTLTCQSLASGVVPEVPSMTLHSEVIGSGVSNFVRQFTGMKMTKSRFTCSKEQKFLIMDLEWLGSKAERKTFVLTSKPSYIGSVHDPYKFVNSTRKFNSVDLPELMSWTLTVDNNLQVVFQHLVDQTGGDVGKFATMILDDPVKGYDLELGIVADDYDMWDDVLSLVSDKTFEVELTRTTTNKIKFSATKCHVYEADYPIPPVDERQFNAVVKMVPESLTITVTDAIDKAHYGE